jgi:hypothetical protein
MFLQARDRDIVALLAEQCISGICEVNRLLFFEAAPACPLGKKFHVGV